MGVMLGCWGGNREPGGRWQNTNRFMASVSCGLTAEDWDQLWTTTLVSSVG